MHFKRMEIHGFKSFAEPTVIEFDRGITCVVGPNGSGKSNICDAVRWVLGAQSAKVLRGDKMEDVIFSGSESRRSRGMAEVTLVIDNTDGALDVDYNEVAITRRMFRSGESEYLINNTPCRMRDIRELIMDTGIGVEGYSIIGQGKISDIISNNTESIREILEETAGIVMYRSRKAEAERKLDTATGNLERVEDIIGELEHRIPGLKEESEKATRFLQLRDRYKELEINITLNNIESIKNKNMTVEEDISELAEKISKVSSSREQSAEKLQNLRLSAMNTDSEIESLRNEKKNSSEELVKLKSKYALNRERLGDIEKNTERIKKDLHEIEQKIQNEYTDAESLYEQRKTSEKKYNELKTNLNEKTEIFDSLKEKFDNLNREIDKKKNDIFEMQHKLSQKQAEVAGISGLKETLQSRRTIIDTEKRDAKKDGYTENFLEEIKTERDRKQLELNQLRKRKIELSKNETENSDEERRIAAETEKIRIDMGKISSRKKTFEELESNYDGYKRGVQFIMKSGSSGLEGVVAELVEVLSGYEIAMETAFGQSMQNVVCVSDDDAKTAIKKLKSNRAGRLTFLPIMSVKSRGIRTDKACETAEGFKGYAVNCIKFKEKYRDIMEYLLGNVIVTDTMDNAVSLSKKLKGGYKIVTLDGELISTGGSITGGKYKNKSADFLERRAEINQLGTEIKKLDNQLSEHEKRVSQLRNDNDKLKAEEEEINKKIYLQEKELFSAENEINMVNRSLIEMASANQRWDRELDNIEKEEVRISELSKELSSDIIKLNEELEITSESLECEILNLSNLKKSLEEQQNIVTEGKLALGAFESEKNKVEALIEYAENIVAGYEKEKSYKSKELSDYAEEKENLYAQSIYNGKAIAIKEREDKEIEELLSEKKEERRKVSEEFDEENKIREQTDRELLALSNQKNELDIRKTRQDTQLENAVNKLWEEFEISYAQALDYKNESFVLSAAIKENREIKGRIRELGEVNISAIEEYKGVSERYDFLSTQKNDIEKSMEELSKIVSNMDTTIRKKYKESFDSVVENFEVVFRELYGGGHAKITLRDETQPFESEIEITAQPPGKQLKHINLLSGGEKTMTAIALMFAVLKTKPTPCCILDEVEAALDDSNLQIFGRYIRKFKGVQFTLITHQKSTMEHADVMYGITMPEGGVSKIYSLKMTS